MRVECINRTSGRLSKRHLALFLETCVGKLRSMGYWRKRRYHLTIVVVTPRESRVLNQKFLKKKKAANILSFDYGEAGELILTPAIIRKEARKKGQAFYGELQKLLAHGLVHLAGLHHECSPRAAGRAERIETELLKRVGALS